MCRQVSNDCHWLHKDTGHGIKVTHSTEAVQPLHRDLLTNPATPNRRSPCHGDYAERFEWNRGLDTVTMATHGTTFVNGLPRVACDVSYTP